ncbi:hypothetical protein C5167_029463 [Papaver somniferum]|uniref:wall-associated receptor kinase-like 1 n=1 Tax=Papaver somniferum TaxID=3469 RepID=UPI000E704A4C|nr:wall-associated receptor kinase-like 1 [Papaver somniferum]RZC93822.1 hypothetical protein C5167_029463 [Papaver somniferum]
MPSLLYVIRRLQAIFFGLLMAFHALEAEVAATRRVQAVLEATIPVSNNGTSISSNDEITIEGCKDRCGSVIIPYPFGMDTSNCYRDVRFKITCNYSNNPPVASLGSLSSTDRYEVLEITVDHYVRINMLAPVTCGTNISSMVYDLPFPASDTRNKLTVLGCSVYGTVASQIYPTDRLGEQMSSKLTRKGCESHCVRGHTKIPPSHCSGYGCCKTKIPSGLASYTIGTTSVSLGANEFTYQCASAFLVDHEYYRVENLLISRNDSFVPMILDWAITDAATCKEAQRNLSSYACGTNTYCLASQNGPGYHCKCSKGYQGNPYFPSGCQDVDECKEPHKCGKGVICINTQGSYNCSCPPDKELEINGLINSCAPNEHRLPSDQKNKRRLRVFVIASSGIGISVIIIFLLGIGYWLYIGFEKRKQMKLKQRHFERNGGLLLKQKITSNDGKVEKAARIFIIEELRNMTDNFNPSRIIGKGGHGTVYKGMLPSGEIVAIKKSKLVDESQVDQFINEVVILSQIKHRHIVKLLGCCLETEVPLLIYEFVSNGTLSHHLHVEQEDGESLLSWQLRVRIASEIAGALAYLHSDAYMPIFHRDIKPTNILLDEKHKAKVADFGLSRSIPVDKTHLTTLVQGTFGYMDPEYFHTSQFTDKSDVYSFGIVLVELLTGEKPVSVVRHEEEKGLALYLIKSMKEDRLFEILDSRVLNEADEDDVLVVAKLAERCLKLNGKKRPTIKEVSHILGVLHEKLSTRSTNTRDSNE